MDSEFPSRDTRTSILDGLKSSVDRDAFELSWNRFCRQYLEQILEWCQRLGLSKHDAEDVNGDLLVCLVRRLRYFDYDPDGSFRAWLRVVSENAVRSFWRSKQGREASRGAALPGGLTSSDFESQLHAIFDREIYERACSAAHNSTVGRENSDRDWTIFHRLVDLQREPIEIAEEFGITRQTVYVIKNRLLETVQQQVKRIEQSGPGQ